MGATGRTGRSKRVGASLAGAAFAGLVLATLTHAQAARTVRDGVYSDTQATRGEAIYQNQCASCHGKALEGAQAPPLSADVFIGRWHDQPLSNLAAKIRNTMPVGAPGTLLPPQAADLVAFLLKRGGFPAGTIELPWNDADLAGIAWPAGIAADTPIAAVAAGQRVYPPLGNMAQLMRGVFFPNSNLIFTVQTRDPAAKPEPAAAGSQSGGFSFVDWGAGIYGGWELIDNAAIALADASPLMLAPGIRCENGRLAPVDDPDWIRFTEEMIAVARKTYLASQSRSQEAVSEITGDLSDACANCHRAYRDIRVPGREPDPIDPSNKASRCLPRGR